jgi:ribosomal protein L12E/L44/L45/RPP1/RPP2
MPTWDETFADAYTKSADRASVIAFEGWQNKQKLKQAEQKFLLDQATKQRQSDFQRETTWGVKGMFEAKSQETPKGFKRVVDSTGKEWDVPMASQLGPEEKAKLQVDTAIRKDALTRAGKLGELLPILDQFDSMLSSIPVSTGMKGKVEGVVKVFEGRSGRDPFAATNLSQIDALAPQIARGFGDVGNLSRTEQKTAKDFIPQVMDAADTRTMKALGGLMYLRVKSTNSFKKAGILDDKATKEYMAGIDERIGKKLKQAQEMGIDQTRMAAFMKASGIDISEFMPQEKEGVTQAPTSVSGMAPSAQQKTFMEKALKAGASEEEALAFWKKKTSGGA